MQDFLAFLQHHWLLSFGTLLVLLILVSLEFIKIRRGTKKLSPQQAIQFINHQNATVVDTRSPDSFATGHIVGSISLPMKEITDQTKKIEKAINKPIIVVCAQGIEAERAANILNKKGYDTYVLQGGLRTWQQEGLPLVKD